MSIPKIPKYVEPDWSLVGRRIRELRGFDTNQAELADAIGVTQSHISATERGRKEMGAIALFRIAQLYGKTVEWLLTGKDPTLKNEA